jgi:hypothetical protein
MLLGLGYVARTWRRYGVVEDGGDSPLDRFMPTYEVGERHEIRVSAPAELAYEAARGVDLQRSPMVRAIFRGRELLMRAKPAEARHPQSLVDEVLALGWGVLDEEPGRMIVIGAVTKPWEADVRFERVAPERFSTFGERGYAKIAWTILVEPVGPDECLVRTETRVATTDPVSRARFRRYWTAFSPGIVLIRRRILALVKRDAERRHSAMMAKEST